MQFFRKPSIESTLPVLVILALLLLSGGGAWFYFRGLLEADLPGVEVRALELGNKTVRFVYTDDNREETLLIHADQQVYNEFSRAEVYFSITPLSQLSENVALQFLFSEARAGLLDLSQRLADRWQPLVLNSGPLPPAPELLEARAKKKAIPAEFTVKAWASFTGSGQTEYFRATVSFPPQTAGEFWIEALGSAGGYGLLDPWYNSSWGYRKQIQIDADEVSGSSGHTNFPMLFSRTDPDLRDTASGGKVASSTAGDIVFVDWENKKIDHEIESYTASTGQLIAWVEVPFVSSTTTRDLFIYYGNASATYQPTNEAVWDSNYRGVWHLNESSAGTVAVTRYDATSQNNDATDNNTVASAAGQISNAADFENKPTVIGERLRVTDNASLSITGTVLTIEGWVNLETLPSAATADQMTLVGKHAPDTNAGYQLFVDNSPADVPSAVLPPSTCAVAETTLNGVTALTTGTWYHMAVVFDGTNAKVYLNGSQDATTAYSTSMPDCAAHFSIGTRQGSATNEPMDGRIDEVHVSASARAPEWLLTEYRNQVDPNSFYAYGGQEVETRPEATPGVKSRGGTKLRGGVKFRWDAIVQRLAAEFLKQRRSLPR